jgi:hypothetical protein
LAEVPIVDINSISLLVSGRFIKLGAVRDEFWLETDPQDDPEKIIEHIKYNRVKIDIFTFSQKLWDRTPKYNYYMEWDNIAALPIETYERWWTKQVNDKTRNMVRKAQKKGVKVRVATFDNALIEGIAGIYNETPVRQGRRFRHYGKDLESIRIENSSFLERSDFLVAYCGGELIGFIKLVYMGEVAGMMQILSKIKDRDKAPNNALIAKAVEVCAERGIRYLTYSKFIYGKKGVDPIAEFKFHNGFKKIDIPKYYIPLSLKGSVGLKLNLHHDFNERLPPALLSYLRKLRAEWFLKSVQDIKQ